MDTKALPTSILAVETWLRELVPPAEAARADSLYPYLFGVATVKLAEANAEIVRLTAKLAEADYELELR